MIISDTEFHKIDVSFKEDDDFLHVATFHRKKGSTEWTVKLMGFSPAVQTKLVEMIIAKKEELANKESAKRDV